MIEINYYAKEAIVDLDEHTALILTEDRELVFEDSDKSKVYICIHSIQDFEAMIDGLTKALETIKREESEGEVFFSKFNDKKFK